MKRLDGSESQTTILNKELSGRSDRRTGSVESTDGGWF